MKCPRCSTENEDHLKLCKDYGAPLTRACFYCGGQIWLGKKFRGECGALAGTSAAMQPVSPRH
jgi:hypothetical protein